MGYTCTTLAVTRKTTAHAIFIEAVGEVDLTTTAIFQRPLMESVQDTIESRKGTALSVDLRRVDFIDSAGLALLVAARKRLALAMCSLQVLLTPGQQPERVLRLSRLDTIMTLIYDSAEA